jgi:hypothetical protein
MRMLERWKAELAARGAVTLQVSRRVALSRLLLGLVLLPLGGFMALTPPLVYFGVLPVRNDPARGTPPDAALLLGTVFGLALLFLAVAVLVRTGLWLLRPADVLQLDQEGARLGTAAPIPWPALVGTRLLRERWPLRLELHTTSGVQQIDPHVGDLADVQRLLLWARDRRL